MTNTRENGTVLTAPRSLAAQWFAVLGGPLAWTIALGAQYGLVEVACGTGSTLVLHLAAAVAFLLALTALGVARRIWLRTGRRPPDDTGGAVTRSRFMAAIGLMASTLFALVIFAQWLGTLFLHPCVAI